MTLQITARMLERWSDQQEARDRLPVLIRKLINETLPPGIITEMNFPGYENIQRSGVDGRLTTTYGNQYIPKGKSVWEFSTSADINQKATNDLQKRANEASEETVFIFVSSRNWPKKDERLENKKKSGWKDVIAYDANNLEQWLENAPYTSLWLSSQIGLPQDHLETPEKFLAGWLQETKPEFPVDILLSNRGAQKDKLQEFLTKAQAETTISVAADTRDEAIAFIAAAMRKADLDDYPAMIMKDYEGIIEADKWAGVYGIPSILIAQSKEIAEKIPPKLSGNNVLIIACVREDITRVQNQNPFGICQDDTIILPRVKNFELIPQSSYIAQRTSYQQVGGSLSALHRVCNKNPAKKEPKWATAVTTANRNFIWLALIGRWDEQSDEDKKVITKLAGLDEYRDWEDFAHGLTTVEEAPLERTSGDKRSYRLFSRLDAFSVIANKIKDDDIDNFLNLAATILSKPEIIASSPKYYSNEIRSGIVEGIIVLNIVMDKMGEIDRISSRMTAFYYDIFAPDKAWHVLADVLPQLAEASPDNFIAKFDEVLKDNPERIGNLFPSEASHFMSNHQHTALLWALELLAQNSERLGRVLKQLCQLQKLFEKKIKGNYGSRPSRSMHSILCSWMPQTAANIEQRMTALGDLYSQYPNETVHLALALADRGDTMGTYNYMPIWREDALGVLRPTRIDYYKIISKSIEIIIQFIRDEKQDIKDRGKIAAEAIHNFYSWDDESARKIKEAICSLPDNDTEISENMHKRVRESLAWNSGNGTKENEISVQCLREIKNYFRIDPIKEQAYLFSSWPDIEEAYEDGTDIEKQAKIIEQKRSEVLREIYNTQGFEGIIKLIELANAPDTVSASLYIDYIANNSFPLDEYLIELLKSDIDTSKIHTHLSHIFGWVKEEPSIPDAMDAEKVIAIINNVIDHIETVNNVNNWEEKKVFLLHAIRIDDEKGREYIDSLPVELQKQYFSYRRINRFMECRSETGSSELPPENKWLVEKYIEYKRPRLGWNIFIIESLIPFEQQFKLLDAMYVKGKDEGGDIDPVPRSYYVQKFLNDAAEGKLTSNQEYRIAMLELRLYGMLDNYSEYRVSFVHRRIGKNPEFFIDLCRYAYKSEDALDNDSMKSDDNQGTPHVNASTCFDIFHNLNLCSDNCPWLQDDNKLDAHLITEWIDKVRKLAEESNISKVVDALIGTGLAHSFASEDEMQPEPAVCHILERIKSDRIFSSFRIGRYNLRGMLCDYKDSKGYTSSALAEEYHKASIRMQDENYPFVSRIMRTLCESYRHDANRHKDKMERWDLER